MDVIARIDDVRRECDVLEHPFYQRWSAGALTREELGFYAGQYRHAVVALADASQEAARKAEDGSQTAGYAEGLRRHADEERSHVALWDEFARAAGAAAEQSSAAAQPAGTAPQPDGAGVEQGSTAVQAPLRQTEDCAQAWTQGEDLLEHLAVLYAIEASQPEIARTKLDGLVQRYGYSAEGPATEYFRLHATLDVDHARQAKELIERLINEEGERAEELGERMVARARAALRGNWELLDGVEGR